MKLIDKRTVIAAFAGGAATLVLLLGGAALAHGGPHGGPPGHGRFWDAEQIEAHLNELAERLDLSTAQEEQIRAIMEEAQAKAAEIREMPRSKEKLVSLRDLHFATEDRIHANLSCEQREELRLLKREHRVQRMEEHFGRWTPDSN